MFVKRKKKKKAKVKKREHGGPAKGNDARENFFKPGGPYSNGKPVPKRFK